MAFVVRLQTKSGVKRLLFKDGNATWRDLQLQTKDVCGIAPEDQLISRTKPTTPEFVDAPPATALSAAPLRLKHGDMLYLVDVRPSAPATGTAAQQGEQKKKWKGLTIRCQHNEKGRCHHCDPVEEGVPITVKCTHGPSTTCPNCSKHVLGKPQCSHADSAFCPLCLPPSEEAEEEAKTGIKKQIPCECGPGQKCPRCLDTGPMIKVDKIPYARMMEEKKALCKFKHSPSIICQDCAPPLVPTYAGKKDCEKGHRPWPEGVCLTCAPPVCVIKEQPFRHCDSISIAPAVAKAFYDNWFRSDPRKQRAALLFGRYMAEPAETRNPGAIRANVYAWYEPPQENREDGVRFLRDMDEQLVHEVAQWLGLEPVGWIVSTMERKTKTDQPVFMSGAEVLQAAKFQDRYKDRDGHSRFVTVILEQPSAKGGAPVSIEPRAYQVSDQCVAAVRDELVVKSPEDPYLLATKPERKGQMPAAIVYRNKPTLPGQSFFPDEFIVKVILSASTGADPDMPFKNHTFPSRALVAGGELYMRTFLADNNRGDLKDRLADFNILCFLAKTVGPRLTTKLCAAIRNKTPLPNDVRDDITGALVAKNMF